MINIVWIAGIAIMVIGVILMVSSGNIEKLEQDVDNLLAQYEDDETVSEEDWEKYKDYVMKPLNRIKVGSMLFLVGTVLFVIGALLVLFLR